jgi:hypothetical protein
MEATVTNPEARVIALADHAEARRRRARRFYGTMGVVLRFEDRRVMRTDASLRGPAMMRTRRTAFETRAPR